MYRLPCIPILIIHTLYAISGRAQFSEVTSANEISCVNTGTLYGNGVSFFDFNHDGWDDLSIACGAQEPKFYVNTGGQFEQVILGTLNSDAKQVHAIQWVDWDNDGDSDLFLSRRNGAPRLYRNDGSLLLTDISASSGVDQGNYFYMASGWCDYDHDGFLDFYLPKYYNPITFPDAQFESELYRGNGDGTFTDVTASAGMSLPPRPCFQAVWFDYDNDGWQDLYLIIDRSLWSNELYHNDGDGTFTNVSIESNTDIYIDAMTGTIGDFDNDLDFDIYVTNGWDGNVLLSNNGDGTFEDVSVAAGVTVNLICWGAQWLDYDNDTWQDLFVATTGNFYGPAQNEFFINNQDGTFTSGISTIGIMGDENPTMATAMGDIDNNGYYDYINSNNAPYAANLWQNEGGDHHWLGVELRGTVSNRDAFGALLKLHVGGQVYARYTHGGENYQGQNSLKEVFGMAGSMVADSLQIVWPRGLHEVYYNIPADQYLYLVEGASENTPIETYADDLLFCASDGVMLNTGMWPVHHWNNDSTSQELVVYETGEYYATVVDTWGNFFNTSAVQVTEYALPAVSLLAAGPGCHGDSSGQLMLVIDNGIEWTSISWNEGEYAGELLEEIPAGYYDYEIVDVNGCITIGSFEVHEPSALHAEPWPTDAICYGENSGSVVVAISGGTPAFNVDTNGHDPQQLPAGNYTWGVSDAEGCETSITFDIGEPEPLMAEAVPSDALCHGESSGSVVVSIAGGTPGYTINWDDYDPNQLPAGSYVFHASDTAGCSVAVEFEVGEPLPMDAGLVATPEYENGEQGTAAITISGGIAPYEVQWSSGEQDVLSVEDLPASDYEVTITDLNGCVFVLPFTIDFVTTIGEVGSRIYQVFPNPVATELFITPSIRNTYSVYDHHGRLVMQGLAGNSIDVRMLAGGVYCIVLGNDEARQRLRFVKE